MTTDLQAARRLVDHSIARVVNIPGWAPASAPKDAAADAGGHHAVQLCLVSASMLLRVGEQLSAGMPLPEHGKARSDSHATLADIDYLEAAARTVVRAAKLLRQTSR